jgi:hypothetical protein
VKYVDKHTEAVKLDIFILEDSSDLGCDPLPLCGKVLGIAL